METLDNNNRPTITKDINISKLDSASLENHYVISRNDASNLKISSTIYNLMLLMDGNNAISDIAIEMTARTKKYYSPEDIKQIIKIYLLPYGLLEIPDERISKYHGRSPLFISIDLLPKVIIDPLAKLLSRAFALPMYLVPIANALIIIYLWPYFIRLDLRHLTNLKYEGMIVIVLLFLANICHELGHASACRYYNISHGPIGFGLYMVFPVFYIDVNESWRLDRKQRVIVDIGGIYFHLLFSICLFCTYLLTGSLSVLTTIVIIYFTILINLNPIFKYDGYWLLSDISGIPNLRFRSYELLRDLWNKIFGLSGSKKNELIKIQGKTKILLVVYAFISNIILIYFIYRLFIWVGAHLMKAQDQILYYSEQIRKANNSDSLYINLAEIGRIVIPLIASVVIVILLIKRIMVVFPSINKRK